MYHSLLLWPWLALSFVHATTHPAPQVCRRVTAAVSDSVDYSAMLFYLGLVTEEGKLHPDARMDETKSKDYLLTRLKRKVPNHHTSVTTQMAADGSPVFMRIKTVPAPSLSLSLQNATPSYYRVSADQTIHPLSPPVEIFRGNYLMTPRARESRAPLPDPATLPGRQPHGESLSTSRLITDPNAVHLGTSQMILLVRRDRKSPASVLAPDKLFTYGMGNCAGVFLEGKGFVLGTHFVNSAITPAEETMGIAIQTIKDAGLSMDGVKARIIGGDREHQEMASALIQNTRALGIPIVETDIFGQQGKDFPDLGRAIGYRFTDAEVPVPFDLRNP